MLSSGILMIDPALFAELRDLCLRSFPERLDQRLSQIEPMSAGRHPALAFSLSWHEGVRPRVERMLLRRYADDRTWWSFRDRQKAQREWTVMRWLYSYGLPAPKTYALGDRDVDSFLLLERPSGQVIALSLDKPATDRQYINTLAALLAQLHRSTTSDSVREVLPRINVATELDRATLVAQQCEDPALMEAVQELTQDQVEAYPPCVLHGDPQLASLRCDARGVTAWLNWENSAWGDPRWDIACVANELQNGQANLLADQFCETYADRAGLQLRDMAYWQALAAVHRWAMTRQTSPTLDTENESQVSEQLKKLQKQTGWAMARLQAARAAVAPLAT